MLSGAIKKPEKSDNVPKKTFLPLNRKKYMRTLLSTGLKLSFYD
jgi:hypothetical protein